MTKKGNGLKLDEKRLNEYRSWTKVNKTKAGLDENRIGRKALDENRLDENWSLESWQGLCLYLMHIIPFWALYKAFRHVETLYQT